MILSSGRRALAGLAVGATALAGPADLDGKPLFKWSGKLASLSIPHGYKLSDRHVFGLGIWDSEVEFHQVKLRILTGKAVPWEKPPRPTR